MTISDLLDIIKKINMIEQRCNKSKTEIEQLKDYVDKIKTEMDGE